MKALLVLALLLGCSFQAFADDGSGYTTSTLKCHNRDMSVRLTYDDMIVADSEISGVNENAPVLLQVGESVLELKLLSFVNGEGQKFENRTAERAHRITNMFSEGMVSAHGYDDIAQTFSASQHGGAMIAGRRVILRPSKEMIELNQPAGYGIFARKFTIALTMDSSLPTKKTEILNCKIVWHDTGS